MSLLAVSVALVAVYAPGQVGPQMKTQSFIGQAPEKIEIPDIVQT